MEKTIYMEQIEILDRRLKAVLGENNRLRGEAEFLKGELAHWRQDFYRVREALTTSREGPEMIKKVILDWDKFNWDEADWDGPPSTMRRI